jgi:hypothetical protein
MEADVKRIVPLISIITSWVLIMVATAPAQATIQAGNAQEAVNQASYQFLDRLVALMVKSGTSAV